MSEPAVRTRGLGKTWPGPVEALRSVDLDVAPGEGVVLVGPNGSGKTTLLGILVGLVRPSAGTAHVFGVPVASPGARVRLGYTPENASLPARATPRGLLDTAARLSGRGDPTEWLDRLDLGAVATRPIGTLSQGTRERVALAQALVHGPDVVLLDEPLTGLDAPGRDRVVGALADLKKRGVALLVATHWPEVLAPLTDRVVALRQGSLA